VWTSFITWCLGAGIILNLSNMDGFKPPEPIDLHSDNVAERWRKWKRQFEFYYMACELSGKNKATQTAILLHAAGPEAQEIHHTFTWAEGEDKSDYKQVLKKFDDYCEPLRNVVYERYQFWSRDHKEHETVDMFVAALRTLSAKCEFADEDDMLRDKLVFAIRDIAVKERLLRESGLTLKKALELCRAAESSKQQIRAMQGDANAAVDVHPVGVQHGRRHVNKPREAQTSSSTCDFCGGRHARGQCPAFGKQCGKYSGYNHFASVCRGGGFRRKQHANPKRSPPKPSRKFHKSKNNYSKSKSVNVHSVDADSDSEYLFVGTLSSNDSGKWYENIVLNGSAVQFKLDTGADANCLPMTLWHKLFPHMNLEQSSHTLRAFGGECIKPGGVATVTAECPATDIVLPTKFFVTDADMTPILGRASCESFKLVQRLTSVKSVHNLTENKPLTTDVLSNSYSDVFAGLGAYDQPYHIELDPSVPPVIQHCRRVPFAKLPALQTALESLEKQGVIAPVDRPTDWVHNLVVTEKKNGSLRLCLDPKPLNKAIRRERHVIPTVEDVLYRLNGKQVFTVVDMKDSYWHVKLDEPSSFLCTFHTPWGRKRFLRMPFGISSASEIMQKRNEQTFADIPGVHVIADDLIIAGSSEAEHDAILLRVLERARERNIKFNLNKLQFKKNEVTYMGHIVTAKGLRPCPKKINAIMDMPCPTDKPSLLRFLGMVRYLAQFIPGESTLTAPLRSLLKKDSMWQWNHEHNKAIASIKEALSDPVSLHFFDVNKPVLIQADASKSGLGACILQDGRPIAFASRALSSAECNYSQIEKELLAICFACSKFNQYCYGKKVKVNTDHKPLEIIFKKPIGMAAPRLQRMLLQLQRYTLDVSYVPGKFMYVADALSRAYTKDDTTTGAPDDIEVMVHSLVSSLPISEQKVAAFQKATATDSTLQQLLVTVRNGWPKSFKSVHCNLRPFWNVRDEIHEIDCLLFRGNCVIVPAAMQKEMLELIHEGHLGVEKSRALARQALYWPGMSDDIAKTVTSCETCITFRASQQKEPLMCHDVPGRPWQKLGADIMTVQGKDFLVVVDYFSKYPELAMLQNKTAKCVITHLKSIMARHGIPDELFTDNMPFASFEFRKFAAEWDFRLTTSSPEFPQSNGQAERTVQTVKRLLEKACMSGQDPYIALLQYRLSPVSGLPYSPAQMLMGRQLRGRLPVPPQSLQPSTVNARPLLVKRQLEQKRQFDKGAKPLAPLNPGDSVSLRRKGRWVPAVVKAVDKAPRSYIVSCGGSDLRRNRRHLLHTPGVPAPYVFDSFLNEYDAPSMPVETPRTLPRQPHVPLQNPLGTVAADDTLVQPPSQPQAEPVAQTQAPQIADPIPPVNTRPKRNCQPPERYQDYVMSKC
jgi:hypothetical protein